LTVAAFVVYCRGVSMQDRVKYAVQHTELVRSPQQRLSTFGSTTISYYVVTGLTESMSVVRDGRVVAERPRIVTPAYLINLEGFSEQARSYISMMAMEHPHEPGLFYTYKNEARNMNVVSESLGQVIGKLDDRLEEENNPLSAIIKGVEELWDVSLLMFIYHLTSRALSGNVADFRRGGLLDMDSSGVPRDARIHIEELFDLVRRDVSRAPALAAELNRWDVFAEYQDRFFAVLRGR
jgi:hypothetical protein